MGKRKKKKRSKVDPQDIQAIAMESTMLPTHEVVASSSKKEGKMGKLRSTGASEMHQEQITSIQQQILAGEPFGRYGKYVSKMTGAQTPQRSAAEYGKYAGEMTHRQTPQPTLPKKGTVKQKMGQFVRETSSLQTPGIPQKPKTKTQGGSLSRQIVRPHSESHPMLTTPPEQIGVEKPTSEISEQISKYYNKPISKKPLSKKEKKKMIKSSIKTAKHTAKEISKYKLKGNF